LIFLKNKRGGEGVQITIFGWEVGSKELVIRIGELRSQLSIRSCCSFIWTREALFFSSAACLTEEVCFQLGKPPCNMAKLLFFSTNKHILSVLVCVFSLNTTTAGRKKGVLEKKKKKKRSELFYIIQFLICRFTIKKIYTPFFKKKVFF